MIATVEQIAAFFRELDILEERKKDVSLSIKEAKEAFVDQYGDEDKKAFKKIINKAYKNHKDVMKNREEFILIEAQTDTITEGLLNG